MNRWLPHCVEMFELFNLILQTSPLTEAATRRQRECSEAEMRLAWAETYGTLSSITHTIVVGMKSPSAGTRKDSAHL